MRNKLFMATLAAAIAVPVIVAPVQAMEVAQTNITDFKDVPKNHFAYTEIMAMKKAGIINGYDDGTFKPLVGITRQHVAALISRALPLEPIREATTFKDVPTSHPYYNDIQRLYRAGIIDGSNGNFNPSASLTRAQMAKILCLAFNLEPKTGYIFTDVGADHWAKDYIATLYASGITTGSEGKFNGNETVTRAQYAVFLYRALNPDKAPVPEKPLNPDPVKPAEPAEPAEPTKPTEPTNPVDPSEPNDSLPDISKVKPPNEWSLDTSKNIATDFQKEKHNDPSVPGVPTTTGINMKSQNAEEYVKMMHQGLVTSENVGITYDQFVSMINDVVEKGTVYDGGSFAVYFDYNTGQLYIAR
ncbi:S-layer homology domain-containing protein [Lysinibacillus mangiferihumi]|uniref:S-layer homology domain-containing protein n=1 Tax=Lysinibacillus mangiferihumi TaxID=1130819 RepID=A0A4U2YW82_9BACI|nr:S-layer homology domain-containing protein [Lysinibacillus mangiferihumi]TKI65275.1 S-layer homology domain-containing protein [Lysinibacillus mangiferihumi]